MQENHQTENCSKSSLGSHAAEEKMLEHNLSAMEEKIVPISGNPFFTSILTKTHIQTPYRAMIPKRFYPFLPASTATVVVSYRNRTWDMRYYGNIAHRRFCAGWKNFVLENNLKMGDAVVFELVDSKSLAFKVQILRGKIPFLVEGDGESTDTAILID